MYHSIQFVTRKVTLEVILKRNVQYGVTFLSQWKGRGVV